MMSSSVSTISNLVDAIIILVEYGDQRKPISITQKDDLISIERKICGRFQFNTDLMKNLQIQWYDNDFKKFIDLDNETWSEYVQSQQPYESNMHNGLQKQLKLVHKLSFEQNYDTGGGLFKTIVGIILY